jgi:hypothetical protein
MTQLDLLAPRAHVPAAGTMIYDLLMALKRGEKLTPITALERYRCFSLSQRMGELKREGWPIKSVMVKVHSGKHVAEYFMQEDVAA